MHGLIASIIVAAIASVAQADRFVGAVDVTNHSSVPMHVIVAKPLLVTFDAAAIASGSITVAAHADGPFLVASAGAPVFRILTSRATGAFAFPSLMMGGRDDGWSSDRAAVLATGDAPAMNGELYAVVEVVISPGCHFTAEWDLDLSPQPED